MAYGYRKRRREKRFKLTTFRQQSSLWRHSPEVVLITSERHTVQLVRHQTLCLPHGEQGDRLLARVRVEENVHQNLGGADSGWQRHGRGDAFLRTAENSMEVRSEVTIRVRSVFSIVTEVGTRREAKITFIVRCIS